MKTKKLLFLLMACVPTVWSNAADYVTFAENFGSPTNPISRTTDNNSEVYDLTGNITSGTYVVLNGRRAGNNSSNLLDNTTAVWPNSGTSAGVITSTSLFNAATPILGVGGSGGFAAYTLDGDISRTGNPWTFLRVFIDGSRFVVGADYTYSFQYASGANENWVWTGGNNAVTDVMVRGLIYTNVNYLGKPDNFWNDIIALSVNTNSHNGNSEPNAGSWKTYSIKSGEGTVTNPVSGSGAIQPGANVVCDVRGYLNKGSVLLVDDLKVEGPRPEITTSAPSVSVAGSAENPGLSDNVIVHCNAAGTYGIRATVSGPGATFFSVTDEAGAPIDGNKIALPGGNIKIKFAPDASATGAQTATLTLSASPDSYGALPVEIALTGNIGSGIEHHVIKNAAIFENGDFVTVKVSGQANVKIFSVLGHSIADAFGADSFDFALNQGVYIITVNGVSYKFVKK